MMPHLHCLAVENGHFDIVKHILENTTDFDLSDTGKLPLFLAAENGYHDILVLLLHSEYSDITKTYFGTTPLKMASFTTDRGRKLIPDVSGKLPFI